MDRAAAITSLAAVALTQDCSPSEAVEIAQKLLGDRQVVTEAEVPELVREVWNAAGHAVWDGVTF